jgi:hypothetical protein
MRYPLCLTLSGLPRKIEPYNNNDDDNNCPLLFLSPLTGNDRPPILNDDKEAVSPAPLLLAIVLGVSSMKLSSCIGDVEVNDYIVIDTADR